MAESPADARAPCSVYRHSPPRDLEVTLTLARVFLILLLVGFVCRECLSVKSGFGAVAFIRTHTDAYRDPPDLFEYVGWPVGMLAVSIALLAGSIARLTSDRRAIAAFGRCPGATVYDDHLEVLLIRRFSRRTVSYPWAEVSGARLYGDLFSAAHVVVTIGRRRRLKLAPYVERAEELVAEVQARAGWGRAT